jgi:hypothetical protein
VRYIDIEDEGTWPASAESEKSDGLSGSRSETTSEPLPCYVESLAQDLSQLVQMHKELMGMVEALIKQNQKILSDGSPLLPPPVATGQESQAN